jgi:hypothetical protein
MLSILNLINFVLKYLLPNPLSLSCIIIIFIINMDIRINLFLSQLILRP